eukprot:TRINITY_DN4681_c0_g1_i4.p1 TRINITY_DN4681_c0_g1~~TRINITY_DN4681_c0_g1_i4.p1  ORF type:complete len:841 (+),score=139.65 TRINITY_DN4681_c0_g1_i4:50-2524(+)
MAQELGIDVLQHGDGVPLVWRDIGGDQTPVAVIDAGAFDVRLTNNMPWRAVACIAVDGVDTGLSVKLHSLTSKVTTMPPATGRLIRVDVAFFSTSAGPDWQRDSAPTAVATVHVASETPAASYEGTAAPPASPRALLPTDVDAPGRLSRLLSTARSDALTWRQKAEASARDAAQARQEAEDWRRRFHALKRWVDQHADGLRRQERSSTPPRRGGSPAPRPKPAATLSPRPPKPAGRLSASSTPVTPPASARGQTAKATLSPRESTSRPSARTLSPQGRTGRSLDSRPPWRSAASPPSRPKDLSATRSRSPPQESAAARAAMMDAARRRAAAARRQRMPDRTASADSRTLQTPRPHDAAKKPIQRPQSPERAQGPTKDVEWAEVSALLPCGNDGDSKRRRKQLFNKMDVSRKGLLSYGEVDRGIRSYLKVPSHQYIRSAVALAHRLAKGVNIADELVDRKEFRVLLSAMRLYFELLVIYLTAASGGLMSREAFERAVTPLAGVGLHIDAADAPAVFDQLDSGKRGGVRLEEFIGWGMRRSPDLQLMVRASDSGTPRPGKQAPKHSDSSPPKQAARSQQRPGRPGDRSLSPPQPTIPAQPRPGTRSQQQPAVPAQPRPGSRSPSPAKPTDCAPEGAAGQWREVDWQRVTASLPAGTDAESKRQRRQLFRRMDGNGSGKLSLAEIDAGVRDHMKLPGFFDAKPAIMCAYKTAKNADASQGADDFVSPSEFRLLMVALRHYFELWVMFGALDRDGDRRVSYDEFQKALPLLETFGGAVDDPEAAFAAIDADGGGMVLFEEFARWATARHLDLPDDDDAPEELPEAQQN